MRIERQREVGKGFHTRRRRGEEATEHSGRHNSGDNEVGNDNSSGREGAGDETHYNKPDPFS